MDSTQNNPSCSAIAAWVTSSRVVQIQFNYQTFAQQQNIYSYTFEQY